MSPRARSLTAEEVLARVQEALAGTTTPFAVDLKALKPLDRTTVRSVPGWVARVGGLQARGLYCLLCEPHRTPVETYPSQVVLNVPAGRYMVDTLDVNAGTWFARESATGGPLVAGLSFTGGAVLVVVRAVMAAL